MTSISHSDTVSPEDKSSTPVRSNTGFGVVTVVILINCLAQLMLEHLNRPVTSLDWAIDAFLVVGIIPTIIAVCGKTSRASGFNGRAAAFIGAFIVIMVIVLLAVDHASLGMLRFVMLIVTAVAVGLALFTRLVDAEATSSQ